MSASTLARRATMLRAELSRLLEKRGPARSLLRRRLAVMLLFGVLTGLLHILALGGDGLHVGVTAALDALTPVFAPAAFIPAALGGDDRHEVRTGVLVARVAVVVAFGWIVAGTHLLVWALTGLLVPQVGLPGIMAIPFALGAVGIAAVATALAYAWPRREDLAQRSAVGVLVLLYATLFWLHALWLRPSLGALRRQAAAHPVPLAAAFGLLALAGIWALMRHTLTGGGTRQTRHAAA